MDFYLIFNMKIECDFLVCKHSVALNIKEVTENSEKIITLII